MSEAREFWRKTLFQMMVVITGVAINWSATWVLLGPCDWVF